MQKICEKDVLAFDYEVYPHWWCAVFKEIDGSRTIITSDDFNITQKYELICKSILAGFNIKNYDLKILQAIMANYSPERVYELSKNIITENEDVLNNINFWNRYLFIDLYDDWKNGSLKEYESNKGLSIEETSVPFDKEDLNEEEKRNIIKYCVHDVDATEELYKDRSEYIQSKLELAKMFSISPFKALKSTNAKLCSIILNAEKIDREPDYKYILPEKIKKYVYDNLPESVLTQFLELNKNEKTFNLFDNQVVCGIGGIHSTCGDNIITKSTDDYALINVDVTSYYPNLIMHFGYMSRNAKSPEVYEKIYKLRTDIKRQAKEELQDNGKTDKYYQLYYLQNGLKLILNTTYGATKNEYNALFDEYQASSLCYTGQILLASLANKLYNSIQGLKVIQTNTDGILVKCPMAKVDDLKVLVSEWETMCGFSMEYDFIESFLQRDVNNYIENTGNEKDPYKLKGKWSNQAFKKEADTNLNAPVVHLALLNYYVKQIPIRKTIYSCTNLKDFCFTTKTGKTYDKTYYMLDGKLIPANKVNRVIASIDQSCGTLYKYKAILDSPIEPNPFSESYKTELSKYKRELSKRELFELEYHIPYGRLDKIAEIPNNCKLVNDKLEWTDKISKEIDKEWYVTMCENKIKELIEV